MKMKKLGRSINYSLRELIRDKTIQSMVSCLYEIRQRNDVIAVSLPLANSRFFLICEDPYHEDSDNIEKLCFHLKDSLFIDELIKLDVLSKGECTDEYDEFSAYVKIVNSNFIEGLYEWIKDKDLIINYGIFSLHTFTGEGYCVDNKYSFHTNKGLFRVFKAFLQKPTHILNDREIFQTFYDSTSDALKLRVEIVHQIIGEIREKLSMKGELSKLFLRTGNQYLLKSSV